MEYKTSYKRIKELMEIRANVQVLEVGVECTEQEKDDVVTFVVEYIPCASEAIRFLVPAVRIFCGCRDTDMVSDIRMPSAVQSILRALQLTGVFL